MSLTGFIISFTVGVSAVLSVMLLARLRGAASCPRCTAALPMLRKPASVREAVAGGWTCSNCGCEVDRNGHKLAA